MNYKLTQPLEVEARRSVYSRYHEWVKAEHIGAEGKYGNNLLTLDSFERVATCSRDDMGEQTRIERFEEVRAGAATKQEIMVSFYETIGQWAESEYGALQGDKFKTGDVESFVVDFLFDELQTKDDEYEEFTNWRYGDGKDKVDALVEAISRTECKNINTTDTEA